jgi:dTDP-4-dehydrorhamnose reductase
MKRVCVLGSNGFIGKNLIKDTEWVGVTRKDVDLTNQSAVEEYFKTHAYDVVVHCAASIDQHNPATTYTNILMFENVARHIQR